MKKQTTANLIREMLGEAGENLAITTEKRIEMDNAIREARKENRTIAIKVLIAMSNANIDDKKGGTFEVPHILKMFEAIPAGKKGILFDAITKETLSIRECELVALKHYITKPFGANRTNWKIVTKSKKASADYITLDEIEWNDNYQIEAAKLVCEITPRNGEKRKFLLEKVAGK
jgi:hypothetical protein